MMYDSEFTVFGDSSFLKIHFIENPGMAFGYEFGGMAGKMALSIFRLVASGAIVYAMYRLIKSKASKGLITCVALILAGAVGNIIDSALYGLIFDRGFVNNVGYSDLAQFSAFGEGYASFLTANVVDMFSFSIFPPIFNVADASISIGVIWILLFQKKYFPKEEKEDSAPEEDSSTPTENELSEAQA